jgi:hypothetical protein
MSSYWDEIRRESLIQEAKETTSPERLRELSGEHFEVKAAVAKNPKTSIETLQNLAKETELSVLLALIQNEALPEALFEVIARHPHRAVPRMLATSPQTPPALLQQLSLCERREVLLAVAKHPNTPPGTLEQLANHPRREIFTTAQKNPKNPLYVEGNPTQRWSRQDIPQSYADLNGAPQIIIEAMTQSSDVWQRRMVLWAPTLSTEQRRRLAKDEVVQIRAEVARLLTSSDALFDELATDTSPLVRATLALNNNLEPNRRAQIARTLPPPQAPERDQLYTVEEQLRQAFGRRTMQQRESRLVGFVMIGVGASALFVALFLRVPLGLLIIAVFLVVLGALMALFP